MKCSWAFSSWIVARQASYKLVFVCSKIAKTKLQKFKVCDVERKSFLLWRRARTRCNDTDQTARGGMCVCMYVWGCKSLFGEGLHKICPIRCAQSCRVLGAECVIYLCSTLLRAFYNSLARLKEQAKFWHFICTSCPQLSLLAETIKHKAWKCQRRNIERENESERETKLTHASRRPSQTG